MGAKAGKEDRLPEGGRERYGARSGPPAGNPPSERGRRGAANLRPPERRRLRTGRAAGMMAVIVVVGCLLAAEPLNDNAAQIDSPVFRAVAEAVTGPMAAASHRLRLDEARSWLLARVDGAGETQTAGGGGEAAAQEDERAPASSDTLSTPVTTPIPSAPNAGTSVSPSSPPTSSPPVAQPQPGSVSAPPAGAPASTTSTTAARPRVTASRPLRVLVVGDSLVLQVGHGVARLAEELPLQTEMRSRPSSGLSRPDFYDWPAALRKAMADFGPDVVVMMFGNNDKQDVTVDGVRLKRFTSEWWDVYRKRVEAVLAIPTDPGRRVVWVGMPIMRSAKFAETARAFNRLYSEVCAHAGASFVDCYRLFSNEQGQYAAYLPNSSGKALLVRNSDGIHMTEAGGDRVAQKIAEVLGRYYDFQ